jgi:hypothetical protein
MKVGWLKRKIADVYSSGMIVEERGYIKVIQ